MNVVLFCHSLLSDWNHGNAHFLRGVVTELIERGARVDVYEPRDAWSVQNLVAERGPTALEAAPRAYPLIAPIRYDDRLDLQQATAAADLVIVHEWNDPRVVRDLGALRKRAAPFRLLFHDTHHRMVSAPEEIERLFRQGGARPVPPQRLGGARMDLARGRRHSRVPSPAVPERI